MDCAPQSEASPINACYDGTIVHFIATIGLLQFRVEANLRLRAGYALYDGRSL